MLELLVAFATFCGLVIAWRQYSVQQRQRAEEAENRELDLLAEVYEALERYATFNMRPTGGDDGNGRFTKSGEDARRRELYALVSRIDTLAHKFSHRAEVRAVLRAWLFEQAALQKAWNGVKDEQGAYELQNRINALLRQARPG